MLETSRSPYRSAPIVEAIIAIDCAASDQPQDDSTMARLKETFSESFPRVSEMRTVEFRLGGNETNDLTPSVGHELEMWRFSNANNDRVFQVSPTRFIYSHLPPYSGWSNFLPEAEKLWAARKMVSRCGVVTRVGVRYINRLAFRDDQIRLEDYLNFYPHTPDSLGPCAGVLCQVQVPQASVIRDVTSLITLTSEPPPSGSANALALDIDVFSQGRRPDDWNHLKAVLDDFRRIKNDIFESVITEKFRESIR